MTSYRQHRCAHCDVRYSYQSSGFGCGTPENDARYCPDCKAVILTALKAVPSRVEKFFEVVLDEIVIAKVIAEHERLNANPPRLFGKEGPPIREVSGGRFRFDPVTRKTVASSQSWVIHLDGVKYHLELWSDATPPRVTRAMEKDLKSGRIYPWENF